MPVPQHDWYVIVKIHQTPGEKLKAKELEHYVQDVADSVYPPLNYVSAHAVFDDGSGRLIRPHWSKDHPVSIG